MSSFGKDEQFLKSNAAAMRALAGGKEHQVTYAGTDTHVGKDDVLSLIHISEPTRRS